MRGKREVSFSGHEFEIEVFDRGQRIGILQITNEVMRIEPLVSDLLTQAGKWCDRLIPSLASFSAAKLRIGQLGVWQASVSTSEGCRTGILHFYNIEKRFESFT